MPVPIDGQPESRAYRFEATGHRIELLQKMQQFDTAVMALGSTLLDDVLPQPNCTDLPAAR